MDYWQVTEKGGSKDPGPSCPWNKQVYGDGIKEVGTWILTPLDFLDTGRRRMNG